MHAHQPTLHILCGKIAAGKSTLAARLGSQPETVVIAEDTWLGALFSNELRSVEDYVRCSSKLKCVMGPHVEELLSFGLSVVLDFPANTPGQRRWFKGLLEATGVPHTLHFLDVSDEVCLKRLRARNAAGSHPFAVTETQFHEVTSYFTAPTTDEGFNILRRGDGHGDRSESPLP
ncbi:MAG: ATP-binding protein [Pseudomonadota bacterium]